MTPEADTEKACRILLADDHDTYRKTISSLFERRGYKVTSASCGEEVLAAAVEQPFDVFVLDYKMPGNEELILVEQLHALQPDVPVILLTGFASLPSAMNAVRLQLFDYIQKGESPDHLLSRVDEAVRHTQLEKKLRASEARYRLLAENIQDVITVFSADGKAAYASPSVKTVLGYEPEEFSGADMYMLVHPEDRSGLENAMAFLMESGSVVHEARFLTRSGRYVWLSTSVKLLRNDFGEPQELVCSSRDITSRKQAEDALQEAEERYRAVVNDLTEIVCRFRADGTITFVNEVYCRFFGKTRDELLGGKWHPVVVPEDVPKIEDRLKMLSSSNSVVDIETRVISGSGEVHWMQFVNHAFFDDTGQLIETQSVGRDITERKRAEDALRASQQLVEGIINTIPVRVFWKDRNLVYLGCNEIFARDAGVARPQDIIGKDDFAMVWRDYAELYQADDVYVITSGQPKLLIEESQTTSDGRTITLLTSKIPLRDACGEICGVLGSYIDITDRKTAEQALEQRESYLSAIIENLPGLVWLKDNESRFLAVNRAFSKTCGRTSPDEMAGLTDLDIWPFELAEKYRSADLQVMDTGHPVMMEEQVYDGERLRWFETFKTPVYSPDGSVMGTTGYARDITGRKEAETQLRFQAQVLEQIQDMVTVTDLEGRITYVNDAVCRELGCSRESLIGCSVEAYGDAAEQRRIVEQTCETGEWRGEIINRTKTGDEIILDCRTRLWNDDTGTPRHMVGISTDVTGRKQYEGDLKRQDKLLVASAQISRCMLEPGELEVSIQQALNIIVEATGQDRAYIFERHSDEAGHLLVSQRYEWVRPGCRAEIGNPDMQNLPLAELYPRWYDRLSTGLTIQGCVKDFPEQERVLLQAQVIVSLLAVPVFIEGAFWGFVGLDNCSKEYLWSEAEISIMFNAAAVIGTAIVRRRLIQQLSEHKARYKNLIMNLHAGIVVHAPDTSVLLANAQASCLLGLSPEQMRGRVAADPDWRFVQEDGSPLPPQEYPVVRTVTGISPIKAQVLGIDRPNGGERIWVLVNAFPEFDDGQLQQIVVTFVDITELKQAEERIRQLAQHLETVREQERKRLSRELHDDIGQILTALKIDLLLVENECTCRDGVKNKMRDMQRLMNEGIQSVHSLCRRLRPGALDDLGLEEALAGLVDDWKRRNKAVCDLHVDLDEEMLSDDIRTAVFRMVQEALTNVSRYASASKVAINLVSDGQTIHISIADNGCGMNAGAESKPTSFGLLGMRERIEALKGELCVESAAGRGTRIEGTIPLPAAE